MLNPVVPLALLLPTSSSALRHRQTAMKGAHHTTPWEARVPLLSHRGGRCRQGRTLLTRGGRRCCHIRLTHLNKTHKSWRWSRLPPSGRNRRRLIILPSSLVKRQTVADDMVREREHKEYAMTARFNVQTNDKDTPRYPRTYSERTLRSASW